MDVNTPTPSSSAGTTPPEEFEAELTVVGVVSFAETGEFIVTPPSGKPIIFPALDLPAHKGVMLNGKDIILHRSTKGQHKIQTIERVQLTPADESEMAE